MEATLATGTNYRQTPRKLSPLLLRIEFGCRDELTVRQSWTMALRRPPTRVELKADDIEEYNEVRRSILHVSLQRNNWFDRE